MSSKRFKPAQAARYFGILRFSTRFLSFNISKICSDFSVYHGWQIHDAWNFSLRFICRWVTYFIAWATRDLNSVSCDTLVVYFNWSCQKSRKFFQSVIFCIFVWKLQIQRIVERKRLGRREWCVRVCVCACICVRAREQYRERRWVGTAVCGRQLLLGPNLSNVKSIFLCHWLNPDSFCSLSI